MTTVFGVPIQALLSQLLVGLINGSFYALLSLGLAIIFGLLNIVNFAHGALYMLGALTAWLLLEHLGIGYWPALIISPLIVGLFGALIERTMLKRIRGLHASHRAGEGFVGVSRSTCTRNAPFAWRA